ncbi:divergent polysaccharide deacetylase family protein [Pseudorhizobium endolithicum]|uniref:divergent polysaccharide deacetylase family protein n=1 Tax=Pseudorhizobium endolithicum TaxID=1191678 RepID=UPI0011587903|nr:divergent polysaccharide deacetylase family protein [Pseudorhizobium endolithicum]
MEPDLHAPLGQNRPAGKRRRFRISVPVAAGLVTVAGVLGLSLYTMQDEPALRRTAQVPTPVPAASAVEPTSGDGQTQASRRNSAGPGANVERTLTDDGSVVNKYSPRSHDGSGPLIIEASRIGQDPRLAGTANEDLLEDSPYGPLPAVSSVGLRPMDHYARPWSGARGTRIAIIVGGLGLSQTGTQRAIEELPSEITLAFAASGNSLQRWMQTSRRQGHEILMQIPMEPFGYSPSEADPATLLADAPAEQNIDRLHEAMASITGYTGIMNHLGGRLLSEAGALEPLLRDIASRGLMFVDDGTSARSASGSIAKAVELPHVFADMVLDTELDRSAILKKLDDLERLALRKGSAVGTASAFEESVQAISQWVQEASGRGIEIVGVSALAEDPADY